MSSALPLLLKRFARTKLCLIDWRAALGSHFDELQPLLSKSIGEVTTTYPTSVRAIRYDVDIRNDRYMGYIGPDYEVTGVEDRWFTVEELQLWHLDPDKVATFLGPVSAPHVADKPVARVSGDFAAITLQNGRTISFTRKTKRRTFLRAVARYCLEHDTDLVPAYTVIADYNAALPDGENSSQAIRTTDVVYDLFKGQSDVFKDMFEILDLTAGSLRLKVTFAAS